MSKVLLYLRQLQFDLCSYIPYLQIGKYQRDKGRKNEVTKQINNQIKFSSTSTSNGEMGPNEINLKHVIKNNFKKKF